MLDNTWHSFEISQALRHSWCCCLTVRHSAVAFNARFKREHRLRYVLHVKVATPVVSATILTASEKAQKFFLSMVSGEISLSSSVTLTSCW